MYAEMPLYGFEFDLRGFTHLLPPSCSLLTILADFTRSTDIRRAPDVRKRSTFPDSEDAESSSSTCGMCF